MSKVTTPSAQPWDQLSVEAQLRRMTVATATDRVLETLTGAAEWQGFWVALNVQRVEVPNESRLDDPREIVMPIPGKDYNLVITVRFDYQR